MPRVKGHAAKLPTSFAASVRLMPPQAIHDEVGYANAQEMIDTLTSRPTLTAGQSEYLETMTILFEAYEKQKEQIDRHIGSDNLATIHHGAERLAAEGLRSHRLRLGRHRHCRHRPGRAALGRR